MTQRTGTVSRGSRQVQDMAEFLRKEIHAGVRPIEGLVNSSQSLSPNVLWSRNVHKQQPERSKIFIPGEKPHRIFEDL